MSSAVKALFDELNAIADARADLNERTKAVRDAAKHLGLDAGALTEVVRRSRRCPDAVRERDEAIAELESELGTGAGVAELVQQEDGTFALPHHRNSAPDPLLKGKTGRKRDALAEALAWATPEGRA